MSQVEQRLRDTFDTMIGNQLLMIRWRKEKYSNALIFSFLKLKTAVENDEPLVELKQITNACISKVEDDDDIEDKDNLLNQLIQWKNSWW
jgi:hypothetical protein